MQLLRALETYIPLAEIFAYGRFYEKEDTAFLDSSLENELGRYSILGLKPYLKLVKGEKFTVNGVESEIGFEEYVRTYLKEHRQENPTELPLTAGAIGYFSYEYGRKKEDVKTRHKNGVDMPDAVLVFYDVFLIEDTREKVLYTVANGETVKPEEALAEVEELVRGAAGLAGDNAGCVIENVNTGEAFRLRENQIVVEKSGSREDSTLADLVCDETDSMADPKQAHAVSGNAYTDSENRGDGLVEETPIPHVSHPHLKITPDFTHEDYKGAIDRMIQYIIEGDIYIANMTRQLAIESPKAPYEVFRTLRKNNPSPFGGFFSKWYLALGALDGMSAPLCYIIPAVLLISALLTAAYLFPPLCRAFFPGQDFPARSRVREPLLLVLSLALFAAASLILGLLSGITVPVMEHITGSIL